MQINTITINGFEVVYYYVRETDKYILEFYNEELGLDFVDWQYEDTMPTRENILCVIVSKLKERLRNVRV